MNKKAYAFFLKKNRPKKYNPIAVELSDGQDRMPLSQSRGIQTEAGKIMPATPDGAIYSDAKLIVLSSRNLPKLEVTFVDCYPKSLSALEYNQQATDTEYLQATVTFGYKYHEYSTPF